MNLQQILTYADALINSFRFSAPQTETAKKAVELKNKINRFVNFYGAHYRDGKQPSLAVSDMAELLKDIRAMAMSIELSADTPPGAKGWIGSISSAFKAECERLGLNGRSFPERLASYSQIFADLVTPSFESLSPAAQVAAGDLREKIDGFVKDHSKNYRGQGNEPLNPTKESLGEQGVRSIGNKLKDIVKDGKAYQEAVGEGHNLCKAPDDIIGAAETERRRLDRTQIAVNALVNNGLGMMNNMGMNNGFGDMGMNPFVNPMGMSMNNGFGDVGMNPFVNPMGMSMNNFVNPMSMSMNNFVNPMNMNMNPFVNPMSMSMNNGLGMMNNMGMNNGFGNVGMNPFMTRSVNFK